MYRHCIFCSADLGANEALEGFPVGAQVAFDGWRGRLWAVCGLCGRWNLSPIEERWEPVEAAEKLFRDARLKVQSENIGLAKLPDGTRLVRVGEAVPGELAAWRYGGQLLRRRRRYFIASAAGGVAAIGLIGGITAMSGGGAGLWGLSSIVTSKLNQRVVHRIQRPDGGKPIVVRRWHVPGIHLEAEGSDVRVHIRDASRKDPGWRGDVHKDSPDIAVVSGEQARALLSRAMPRVNRSGATRDTLRHAEKILASAGSADQVIARAAAGRMALGKRAGGTPTLLGGAEALAFEMALHEARERAALEGELVALERAWKEAEEIAAIADSLPGEALLNRLLARMGG